MEYEVDITHVALAEKAYLWMIEQLSPENAENQISLPGLLDFLYYLYIKLM
ncbi:MAG: hypothetical protein MGG11_13915 [Trichodesmium sp. MAG_R03]|jgi:hypothetical protein|nr:hypothetical protein [Trichodesmium sp. MAG_R03]